eukprot:363266_1
MAQRLNELKEKENEIQQLKNDEDKTPPLPTTQSNNKNKPFILPQQQSTNYNQPQTQLNSYTNQQNNNIYQQRPNVHPQRLKNIPNNNNYQINHQQKK